MNSSEHREVACAILIDTRGHFLLQQRDDVVGILHRGKVGLFGGHREGDETLLECVVREVHEELTYFVPAARFEYLASVDGRDIDADSGSFSGDLFIARDIPVDALVVTEGSVLVINPDEVIAMDQKLTPTARFAMQVIGTPGF
jgi:8-oxo-dGTP diphosphatase